MVDWDLNRIHAKGYADNVVDLMVGKLNRLPVETVNALKQLACLGNSAEFALLALVHENSVEELHSDLKEALRTGLVPPFAEGTYRFLHDRVREAAYSLIPEQLRPEAHLRNRQAAGRAHTSREAGGGDLRDRQPVQPRRGLDHLTRRTGAIG